MKFDLTPPNEFAPFHQIPNGKVLENVLNERLPYSAELFNMMKMEEIDDSIMNLRWFTLYGTLSTESWIVVIFEREEGLQHYGFSQPANPDVVSSSIDEFKSALIASPIIDVSKEYHMIAERGQIVEVITEALTEKTGMVPGRRPNYCYWMPDSSILSLNDSVEVDKVVVRPLDRESGAKLLADNWPFRKEGTRDYVRNQIAHFPSAGVYVNDEAVSGVLTKRDGNIGMTFTDPNHRRKGYGAVATKHLTIAWGELGLIPCLHVVIGNDASKQFHENIGFQLSHVVVYIFPVVTNA